jgi:hypothetical protein
MLTNEFLRQTTPGKIMEEALLMLLQLKKSVYRAEVVAFAIGLLSLT